IPARRAETGAQINERLAGELLLAKGFRLFQDLLGAGERAVRLLIAESPERRHLRVACEPRVLGHEARRLSRADDEQVDRQRRGAERIEAPLGAREVERAVR